MSDLFNVVQCTCIYTNIFCYFSIDVDTALLTVLSYSNNTTRSSAVEKMVSDRLCSIKDYFFYRKLKATPFVDLKLPSKHHTYRGFDALSSSDDEDDCNIYHQKFLHLHPEERTAVLQKSESILKLSPSKFSSRQRTFSDNVSIKDLSGSDRSRPRSLTHPHSTNSIHDLHSKDNNNVAKPASNDLVLKEENGALVTENGTKGETLEQLTPSSPVSPQVVDESISDMSDLSESSSQEKEDHRGTGSARNICVIYSVSVHII